MTSLPMKSFLMILLALGLGGCPSLLLTDADRAQMERMITAADRAEAAAVRNDAAAER